MFYLYIKLYKSQKFYHQKSIIHPARSSSFLLFVKLLKIMWLKYLKVWASGIHVYDKLISFFLFLFFRLRGFLVLFRRKTFFLQKTITLCNIWIEFQWTRFLFLFDSLRCCCCWKIKEPEKNKNTKKSEVNLIQVMWFQLFS